jgi:catechol 2,3-dioxygenase-like lactoylglutathione lyase family enzyme
MTKISVCIDVLEMEKAIQFYTEALCFKLVEIKKQYTELLADGITVYLSENAAGTNPLITGQSTRNYERHWTPIHLDVHVSDINRVFRW